MGSYKTNKGKFISIFTEVLKYLINFTRRKNYISSEINMLIVAGNGCIIIYKVISLMHV
jgi:hypothetical protein